MTKRRQTLGREGEQQAARFLVERGYQIVSQNVRAARVEIDLIAKIRRTIVFVEVKTRRATSETGFGSHGRAAEAVDERKQQRLRRGAMAWLEAHPNERRRYPRQRFDVVTCIVSAPLQQVELNSEPQSNPRANPQNTTTALPKGARWSIEHWEGAF